MTKEDIKNILDSVLYKEENPFKYPSQKDWHDFCKKFDCILIDSFKYFINFMSEYSFPGDIFNVSTDKTNGNDSIAMVYELEMKTGNWNKNFIPFYGIGNGDYFCINLRESPNSSVYYYYHEDFTFEYIGSFDEWLKDLPNFLK